MVNTMEKKVTLTTEGHQKLVDELAYLKGTKREEVKRNLAQARSFGEARISEIEEILKNVEIIDESNIRADIINLGSTVKVLDCEFDEEITYKIVGTNEANPLLGKISVQSPIGNAMLGKGVGEEVNVSTPSGELKFKILSVERSKSSHAE